MFGELALVSGEECGMPAESDLPTYMEFYDLLTARTSAAAVAWIEANPQTMASVDAEFTEDATRFRYIIDHNGELPPA